MDALIYGVSSVAFVYMATTFFVEMIWETAPEFYLEHQPNLTAWALFFSILMWLVLFPVKPGA